MLTSESSEHTTFNKIQYSSRNKMQMLTRQVLLTLNKNVSHKIATNLCATTGILKVRRYCEDSPKQNLLKYPALKLEETMSRFLRTVEPLLNVPELEITKKLAENFIQNEGKELQKHLEEVAESEENWLAPRWLKTAYLQYRDPVTVYSSPGMIFPMAEFKDKDEFIEHAAKLIVGMIKYKKQVDDDEIPVVKMGENELDNSQFHMVYGTCRIPQPKEDQLALNPDSKHVVVIYKHHFYKLPVYGKDGEILNVTAIEEMLQKIVETEKERGVPYGILTTDHRDKWAAAYAELMKSPKNAESIKTIQQALFTVSLDASVPYNKENVLTVRGLQCVHGGTFCENGANRWMDKTIQLIVNANGMCGFCYEHSPAEGQPVAQMGEYLSKILPQDDEFADGPTESNEELQKLEFDEPSAELQLMLKQAETSYTKLVNNFQLQVTQFQGFGKGFLKTQKLSPDSFIQMAMQYAFHRLHKVPASQYETAHLRIFTNGRTETIRSCSIESVTFAKGMLDGALNDEKRVELLRKAVSGHREYTTMALTGNGVDRHLLGLKLMSVENDLPLPKFFQSPGYVKSLHYRLSTSQVASKDDAFMCYGPMVDDGYSCCYNPRENDMFFAVGAWQSNKDTCAKKFMQSLEAALMHMKTILEKTITEENKPKSKL